MKRIFLPLLLVAACNSVTVVPIQDDEDGGDAGHDASVDASTDSAIDAIDASDASDADDAG